MKTIKLHTALKLKNRLAGEVRRLERVLSRENSRRNDNPSKVDAFAVDDTLINVRKKLIKLKSAIAAANVGIYPVLARMEETKAALSFYSTLNTHEGVETIPTHTGSLEYVHKAYLNRERMDELLATLQDQINEWQDEVDAYNSTTTIEIDLD